MNDKVFFDTNILVYSYSNSEPHKQTIARKLITDNDSFISTQIIQELTHVLTRKLKFSYLQAVNVINECCQNNNLSTNSKNTILQACQIAQRYGFSFYDSLVIAAALENNCTTLYSEDLNNGQLIDSKLKIINPFLG